VRDGAIGEAPDPVIGQIRLLAYVNVYRRQVSSADLNYPRRPRSRSYRSPALFLQNCTQFATIGAMLFPSQPIRLDAEDKLAALRRLDKSRAWNSLDD